MTKIAATIELIAFLLVLVGVPALIAIPLSSRSRRLAFPLALLASLLFLVLIPNGGAHSPVNLMIALVVLGFAVGCLITEIVAIARARRMTKAH